MTIQKFITYRPFHTDGKRLDYTHELKLDVLETSGNYLLHKDLLRHLSFKKQKTASSKTRSEVQGGGRKPWRQKGTGRARAGSNRSPLWKGGGVIFGPKPKKIFLKSNKKERSLALQTLLYNKKNNIIILDNLEDKIIDPKTSTITKIFQNCTINLDQNVLLVVSKKTIPIKLATQNLKNVELIAASNLNTICFLKAKQILITSLALDFIKEIYCE